MKLGSSFTVPAAPDKVLASFLDATTMQSCIPGCEELVQVDDRHYQGILVNEVAHVRFTARFTAEITSITEPPNQDGAHVLTAVLKGEDRRLGSTIKVEAALTVAPREDDSDSSDVSYDFELAMWGKLGRLGESVIRRRSMEVERQFVEALAAVSSGRPVPPAKTRPVRKPSSSASAVPRKESDAVGKDGAVPTVAEPSQDVTEWTAAQPSRHRREDWVILGLAVAAAFAYGALLGGRNRRSR